MTAWQRFWETLRAYMANEEPRYMSGSHNKWEGVTIPPPPPLSDSEAWARIERNARKPLECNHTGMTEPTNITLHFPDTPHVRNQSKIAELFVECEECGDILWLKDGGVRLSPGDNGAVVYCDGCSTAEAQE